MQRTAYSVSVSGNIAVEAAAAYLSGTATIKRCDRFGCSQGAASSIQAAAEDKRISNGVMRGVDPFTSRHHQLAPDEPS